MRVLAAATQETTVGLAGSEGYRCLDALFRWCKRPRPRRGLCRVPRERLCTEGPAEAWISA